MEINLGLGCQLDLDALVESRMLVQSNSGGGKSWLLRRLLEQTFGKIQQLVFDLEDEFFTLREAHDYILAGRANGDCPANPGCAALLARRLLENNVSAIIGISELKAHERQRFMRIFLEELIAVPQSLRSPRLIIVDEAHVFAPETGKHGRAEATEAVIDLMTRGRKRGLCGVLATQRISKLHKDAVAECNNYLIGRCSLDVDMKRAADTLGMTAAADAKMLRNLAVGNFYAFGPAFKISTPERVVIGPVHTPHGRSGKKQFLPVAPGARVKELLAKLADLPQEAEQEGRTVAELRAQLAALKAQKQTQTQTQVQPADTGAARAEGFNEGVAALQKEINLLLNAWQHKSVGAYNALISTVKADFEELRDSLKNFSKLKQVSLAEQTPSVESAVMAHAAAIENLSKAERAILHYIFMHRVCSRSKAAYVSGYSVTSSSFKNAISSLMRAGYLVKNGNEFSMSPTGETVFQVWWSKLPPDAGQLVAYWRAILEKAPRALFDGLLSAQKLDRLHLSSVSGYSATSSSFKNALSLLRMLGLVEKEGEMFKLSNHLRGN